jgi:hypothetical protein
LARSISGNYGDAVRRHRNAYVKFISQSRRGPLASRRPWLEGFLWPQDVLRHRSPFRRQRGEDVGYRLRELLSLLRGRKTFTAGYQIDFVVREYFV